MAKRKAGVNDIIYELDNDDIELSSDDDNKETKIRRFEVQEPTKLYKKSLNSAGNYNEIIHIDCSGDDRSDILSPNITRNGGKSEPDKSQENGSKNQLKVDEVEQYNKVCKNSTFLTHENIVIDSPASNSDLGVVGCENRTPLVTVRFKDTKLASTYKQKVRDFLINLLKNQSEDSVTSLGDSDVELDIWPEELFEEEFDKIEDVELVDIDVDKNEDSEDNIFFVDTTPCDDSQEDIPKYSQTSSIISNITKAEEESPPVIVRRGPTCFNCDGEHQLKDCSLPRNYNKIAAKRKAMAPRVGRYHVEDEQKYGHLIPGRISGNLRHALGLKRHELPLHIYRMRLLGYPPGWLEEARISHSGITMFDSTGNEIQDPGDEEGEYIEPGSKDKFDIKKILDFPGFNVPASSRYLEEAHLFGLPPMSEQDSKLEMLEALAPNAMKAYKRKKLTFFPSSNQNPLKEGQAEMELDSGDEIAEFPSIPPLPDEEPPKPQPPPPPPSTPPPPPLSPPQDDKPESTKPTSTNDTQKDKCKKLLPTNKNEDLTKNNNKVKSTEDKNDDSKLDLLSSSDDELEVIEVVQVNEIPVPEDDHITIDDDDDDKSQLSSGRDSPSLDVLEEKKRRLLNALKSGEVTLESDDLEVPSDDDEETIDVDNENEPKPLEESEAKASKVSEKTLGETDNTITPNEDIDTPATNDVKGPDAKPDNKIPDTVTDNKGADAAPDNKGPDGVQDKVDNKPSTSKETINTPESKGGKVKNTLYGTPVLNVASPFLKLPSDDKFAKDICDVLNYENLPNSTGKFKQISSLLKRVKSEVDRIQDS